MTIDQRLERLEKHNRRLTAALTLMAVAICAVVTVAATNVRDVSNSEIGRYEFHMGLEGTKQVPRHYMLDSKTGYLFEVTGNSRRKMTRVERKN